MLNNTSITSSKKVAVQRKPDGTPFGIAVWFGAEVTRELFDKDVERFSFRISEGKLVLEKSPTGRKIKLQKARKGQILGSSFWIPHYLLSDMNAFDETAELGLKLEGGKHLVIQ